MDNALLIADYCEKKLIDKNADFEIYSHKEPCFIFTLIQPEKLSEHQKQYFKKVKLLLMYQRIRNDIITKEIYDIFDNSSNLIGILVRSLKCQIIAVGKILTISIWFGSLNHN